MFVLEKAPNIERCRRSVLNLHLLFNDLWGPTPI